MEYIEEYLNHVNEQRRNFDEIVHNAILELEPEVRKIVKERWSRGESVNGGKIVNKSNGLGYASLKYKNLKLLKNPKAEGNVDLTLSGSLGDKIQITISQSGNHEIISSDSKYFEIGKKYGFDEFGLTNEENKYIMDKLGKKIIDNINNLIL